MDCLFKMKNFIQLQATIGESVHSRRRNMIAPYKRLGYCISLFNDIFSLTIVLHNLRRLSVLVPKA